MIISIKKHMEIIIDMIKKNVLQKEKYMGKINIIKINLKILIRTKKKKKKYILKVILYQEKKRKNINIQNIVLKKN